MAILRSDFFDGFFCQELFKLHFNTCEGVSRWLKVAADLLVLELVVKYNNFK
jgi:hypothetical protein